MSVSRKSLFVAYVLSFCGVIWGAQQATTPRQPTAPAQTANVNQARATISGTVNSASSGQPVRKALVTLLPGNQGNRGQQGFGGAVNAPGQPAVPAPPIQTNAQAGQTLSGAQNPQAQNGQNPNRGGGGARSITAADDGTFTFTDVAPGTYRIRVDRDGFLPQEYGQRSWTGTGVPLTVMAGQTLSGIGFQLVQGGTIVGRILDENFEPVTDIEVQSLTYSYQNGTRTLVSERQVQTNDLGEYRLYWLTPGDHYVSAVPRPRRGGLVQGLPGGGRGGGGGRGNNIPNAPGVEGQPEETYASTFYPGSIDPERAAPVRVSPATEIRGIDFVLRPTPTVRVSGRVTGVDVAPTAQQLQQQAQQQNQQQARGGRGANNVGNRGNPPNDNRGRGGVRMQVLLTRLGTSVSGGRGGGGGGRGGGGRGGLNESALFSPVNPDGTFEIANIIPGSYNLFAIQQTPNQIYSTRVRLEVGPGGVHGLNLAVRPGVEVPGQIYVDGTAPSNFQMNRLRVNLNSIDDLPIGNSNAQVDETGKFNLTNVAAMSYRINVQGLPAGAYLIAGRYGNSDALGDPLQVDQSSPLSLQIGFNAGQIGVNVTDSLSQPFSGAITVLIPAVRTRLDLYKTATSDSSGQVVFTGVAPGDYKILAWEDVPQGAYLNSDFVQPYEDRAQSVHVDRGGAISAQMKVIPRNQQ